MMLFSYPNKKISFYLYLMVLTLIVINSTFAENSKKGVLKRKVMEISSLNTHVMNKISLAILTRDELRAKKRAFIDEILNEKNHRKIMTYEEAKKIPRIQFNLKLIQRLNIYIERLDKKIRFFNEGKQKFEFYYNQATDEIKLIEILDDMEVKSLIHNINRLIDIYLPEVEKPLFSVRNIQLNRSATVWSQLDSSLK